MIKKELIIDRLSRVREYVKRLHDLASLSKDEFLNDHKNYYSAARLLQIAIEACLDVGHHIVSRNEFRRPKDYKDIFLILGDEKVIPMDFAQSLVNMAKYRNRLVHLYSEVTPEEIYSIIQGPINDLEKYSRYIIEFISR